MSVDPRLGLIALTRFGYGPRGDGDVAVAGADPKGFLRAELEQPGIALLSGPSLPDTKSAIQHFFSDREMRKAARAQAASLQPQSKETTPDAAVMRIPSAANASMLAPPAGPAGQQAQPNGVAAAVPKPPTPEQVVFRDEALARIRRGIEARAGFVERLVAFWSNHFCICANKGGFARITAGAFEREAIRPHVLGKFPDMLLAVERHPAMQHFLDNARSVGPHSLVGERGHRGLNENLGREILELHTLGVGSGYTQSDVTALAKILTGWTYAGQQGRLGEPGTFVFNANAHEPGPIALLGKTYAEDGSDQAQDALLDIARRPETARFVARKLAAAFVADQPNDALVDKLTHIFIESGGDLKTLSLALVDAPEAWALEREKMRTPYEYLLATQRLLGHTPDDAGPLLRTLVLMGMGLWTPSGPNGYSTQSAAWATPEGMKVRLDYAAQVAARLKDPPNPSELLEAMCGGASSAQTRQAVARAESRQQGLAILLMSPEMQRS